MPPIFSHSTPKKFALHDRNITDEQVRACAHKDGVICLNGVGLFIDGERHQASVSKLSDTMDYVAQLVGPRHVGIGLDYMVDGECMARYIRANARLYGGGKQYPSDGHIDFAPPSFLPEVSREMKRRGYSDEEVCGMLGENYLRVLEAQR
jgi:membrane dipeptidase